MNDISPVEYEVIKLIRGLKTGEKIEIKRKNDEEDGIVCFITSFRKQEYAI